MTGPEKLRQLADDIAGLIGQERTLAGLSAPPADVHERVRQLNAATISPELGKWFVEAAEKLLSRRGSGKRIWASPQSRKAAAAAERPQTISAQEIFLMLHGRARSRL